MTKEIVICIFYIYLVCVALGTIVFKSIFNNEKILITLKYMSITFFVIFLLIFVIYELPLH